MKNNKIRERKGFTLVELMVTLVIIGIILAIAVPSLMNYIRNSRFQQNNSYAETVYYAAQSSLNHYKANGQLDEFRKACVKKNGAIKVGKDQIKGLSKVPQYKEWKYEERLYALILNADSTNVEEKELYKLLSDYIYDKSILKGTICVEFDPVEGVVYSASYSDKADEFYYDLKGEDDNDTGKVNISDREEGVRKKRMVGYYDASLSAQSPSSRSKPAMEKVELVNGEELTLEWKLKPEFKDLTQRLAYKIKIYNHDTKKLLFTMDINKSKEAATIIRGKDSPNGNQIKCKLTMYDKDGKEIHDPKGLWKDVPFRAYAENNKITLVLDAVDLAAIKAPEKAEEEYNKNTYSISRFGMDFHNIYARIQTTGVNQKNSPWKQSNVENPYFATAASKGKDKTYTIKNARHLFNIRYSEFKEKEASHISYQQKGNAVWSGKKSILENKHVYNKCVLPKTSDKSKVAFPMMEELSKNSSFDGKNGNVKQEIQGLILDSKESEKALGLFGVNHGTIVNTTLQGVEVTGVNAVGALCGVNEGTITHTSVKDGTVTGIASVGGIIGKDVRDRNNIKPYEHLTNGAMVSGSTSVGGVIGWIEDSSSNANTLRRTVLSNCKNYGAVVGQSPEQNPEKKESKYIGGIAGFVSGGTISNCTSTPLAEVKFNAAGKPANLYGDYVGGIAGMVRNSTITDCSTGKKDENNKQVTPYVIGRNYVGGIVGILDQGTLTNKEIQYNRSHVVGASYVGGIVGANAQCVYNEDKTEVVGVRLEYQEGQLIQKWTNTGVVMATDSYAGGITGYNAGKIENCSSEADTSVKDGNTLLEEAVKIGAAGNYVGGIAGYNVGSLYSGRSTTSIVAGNNYVGGIVGCNVRGDRKGYPSLSEYGLSGGYISGNRFVGGCIGLNTTTDMYTLNSNPNVVKGNYYVGGVLGGNIINESNGVSIDYQLNNFLGVVQSKTGAFVGGCVGYAQLLSGVEPLEVASQLCNPNASDDLQTTIANTRAVGNLNQSGGTMSFVSSSGRNKNVLDTVSAQLYVGGIIGYSAQGTNLYIKNMVNEANVRAFGSMKDPDLSQTKLPEGQVESTDATYSYAGGIIGIATEKVTIEHCSNAENVLIQTTGTYTGGLAEANLGSMIDCTVGTLNGENYIGGVVGLNKPLGTINNCRLNGQIYGNSNLGGMVSRNEGKITGCTVAQATGIQAVVIGNGENIGGIAAVNVGTSGLLDTCSLRGNILGNGTNVGGIAGRNIKGAAISKCDNRGEKEPPWIIQGKSNVGGFVGYNDTTKEIGRCVNRNQILGSQGSAGGITGYNGAHSILNDVMNNGTISSVRGKAGGISGENLGRITGVTNTASVDAPRDMAGGIAAVNKGHISSCYQMSGAIGGAQSVGGIAGENTGWIESCHVQNNAVTIANKKSNGTSCVGGIAGTNEGQLTDNMVGNLQDQEHGLITNIKATGSDVNIGGIAGENRSKGKIIGGKSPTLSIPIFAQLALTEADQGNIGGAVGKNLGQIQNYSFDGSIKGNQGSKYGTGGIAGINGSNTETGTIDGCSLNGTVIGGGTEDSDNGRAYVGGIAGQNKWAGVITNSTLATTKNVEVEANLGYLGGMTGNNQGILSGNQASDKNTPTATIKATATSKVGGLVGVNTASGRVNDSSTGKGWTIQSVEAKRDDIGTGGIIGVNQTTYELSGLVNRATVISPQATFVGGIIGVQMNDTTERSVISDCRNEGTISGYRAVAGIIGYWYEYGGTLLRCYNQGNVEVVGDGGFQARSGGIVGEVWANQPGMKIDIIQCGNDGNITVSTSNTQYIGGILGYAVTDARGTSLTVSDCYHAGIISNKEMNAAIVSKVQNRGGDMQTTILRCVNYGRGTSLTGYFNGICGELSSASIEHCFNMNQTYYAISKQTDKNKSKNYYIKYADKISGTALGEQIAKLNWNGKSLDWTRPLYDGSTLNGVELKLDQTPGDRWDPQEIKKNYQTEIEAYYKRYYGGVKLSKPDVASINESGGTYTVQWNKPKNEAEKVYYYELKVYKKGDSLPDQTIWISPDQTNAEFVLNKAWTPKTEFYLTLQAISGNPSNHSDLYTSAPLQVATTLPKPKVSFIMEYGNPDELKGHYVLDNPEEYKSLGIANWQVSVTSSGSGKSIRLKEGQLQSGPLTLGRNTGYIRLQTTAQATTTDSRYQASKKMENTSFPIQPNRTQRASVIGTGQLTGTTPKDLKFQCKVKNPNNEDYLTEYRVELVQDVTLPSKKVLSETLVTLPQRSGESMVSLDFAALTQGELEAIAGTKIQVRRYPWTMGIARYYEDLPAGDLGGNGVYVNGNRFQSIVLASNTKDGVGFTNNGRSVLETFDLTVPKMQPKPKNLQSQLVETNGKAEYTFTWDAGSHLPCDVQLIGYKGSEPGIEVASGTDITTGQLVVDGSNWKYDAVELVVSCLGESKADGTTVSLTSVGSQRFPVSRKLTTIPRPTVSLASNSELQYNVTWNALTDTEEVGYLKEYKITATNQSGTSQTEVAGKGVTTQQIDLGKDEKFVSGDKIQITVTAISTDPLKYGDSIPSVPAQLTLPARMTMPSEVDGFIGQVKPSYDIIYANAITQAELQNPGVAFTVTSPKNKESGKYKCEAVITDTADGDVTVPLVKLSDAVMDGTLKDAQQYVAGIDPIYAGKYLRIRIRSTSDSQISSKWTPWFSYQLPRVKIATPNLAQGTATSRTWTKVTYDGVHLPTDSLVQGSHVTLDGTGSAFANSYRVEMNTLPVGNPLKQQHYSLLVQGTTDPANPFRVLVKYEEIDQEFKDAMALSISPDQLPTTYVALPVEVTPIEGTGEMIYTYQIPRSSLVEGVDANKFAYKINVNPILQCIVDTSGAVRFQLIAPDLTVENQVVPFMEEITVRGVAGTSTVKDPGIHQYTWTTDAYYAPSFRMSWHLLPNMLPTYQYELGEIGDQEGEDGTTLGLPTSYYEYPLSPEEFQKGTQAKTDQLKKSFHP
ncbi:MAG: prepilin-type N-terminal cleavage/methylation domain-containing protein [Lachnospiraceae bacterium]